MRFFTRSRFMPTRGRSSTARRMRRLALLTSTLSLSHPHVYEYENEDVRFLSHARDYDDDFTSDLRPVEDLRSYPDEIAPNIDTPTSYRTISGGQARVVYKSVQPRPGVHPAHVRKLFPAMYASFENPRQALVCVRRRARRSVMFAMSKMGKRSRPYRRPVWTDKSYIRCS